MSVDCHSTSIKTNSFTASLSQMSTGTTTMGDGRLGNVWRRGIGENSSVFISKLASFPDPCPARWVSGNEAVLKQHERLQPTRVGSETSLVTSLQMGSSCTREKQVNCSPFGPEYHHHSHFTVRRSSLLPGLILSPHLIKSLGTRQQEGNWLTSE